ncbi:uncharacterized protein LOC106663877 [Cimex lectularius]|uniref:Uncharacterized protein n=1 Tax=Cimex lectularius TaxID=79782 RepID=A0A8I6RGJ8_CIMLE|nr:uncharacterized protein LOC106663877 [Cimex lectularius]XP_014244584.1 uncharacterized protein LOC106663877 [Cimex lectularius]
MEMFGEVQGKYIYPREMTECKEAAEEIMKKRPIVSFRIFLNDIDEFIPQELAKVFVLEKFQERNIPAHETSSSSSDEEDIKSSQRSSRKKSIKSQRSKSGDSKGTMKEGSAKNSEKSEPSEPESSKGASSGERRKSKKASTRRASSKKGSIRKASSRRASSKKGASRRASSRRASSRRASSRRASSRRASSKTSRKRKKKSPPIGQKQVVLTKRQVGKVFQKLWPIHVLHRPKCHKRYDWLVDYAHLEEKRLTAQQILPFDVEKAKALRNKGYVFSEELKTCLKKKFWYYTRYMPQPPQITAPLVLEEEKLPEKKTPVELIVNKKIQEYLNEPIKNKPIEFYQKDLAVVEPSYEIYASMSIKNRKNLEKLKPEVRKIIKYLCPDPTNPMEFKDHIYTCTTFIFDITREDADIDEAKAVLDLLTSTLSTTNQAYREKIQSFFGIHTYFLISPVLTWGESKDLKKLAVENVVREEYFPKRLPHPRYKKHYDFENYVHDKSYQYRDIMRILIIGVGLVYGPGGGHLNSYIDLARENKTFLPIFGPGKNLINTFHSAELARLILYLLRNFPYFTPYIVAAEKKPVTQKQILEVMGKSIAENYTKIVPFCFNKTFGIPQSALDIMSSECYIYPSYLTGASGWVDNTGFMHEGGCSMVNYIENGSAKPLRIVIFGPFSLDQTKISMDLSKHYRITYINPSKAVFILLKLVMRMQDIVLALGDTRKPFEDKFRYTMGKNKMNRFNVLRLLAWQREFRRYLLRNKSLYPLRSQSYNFNLKLHEYLSETQTGEPEKMKGPESLLYDAKSVLLRYEKIIKSSPGTLIPARLEVVAEIVHELLQHPILKFTGYILDGVPATEVEAEIIFTRTQGLGGTDEKPPESKDKDLKKQGGDKEKPEKEKVIESKFAGHYERLPNYVFHTAKKSSACMKDCVTKQAKSFQREYMDKFQHLEFYKHNIVKIKSTLDFFTANTSILPITFDTSRESVSQILKHIYFLLGKPEDYGGKYNHQGIFHAPTPGIEEPALRKSSKVDIKENNIQFEDDPFSKEVFSEMKELADKCLPYGYFLNRFLFSNITDALIQTATENPHDPIDFFSEHLFKHNIGGKMPHQKILPPLQRSNLDTYPFNIPKHDKEYSTHL